MTRHSSKLIIKLLRWMIVPAVTCAIVFSVGLSLALSQLRAEVYALFTRSSPDLRLESGPVVAIFPYLLYVPDLEIRGRSSPSLPVFSKTTLIMKFSLSDLLRGRVVLADLTLKSGTLWWGPEFFRACRAVQASGLFERSQPREMFLRIRKLGLITRDPSGERVGSLEGYLRFSGPKIAGDLTSGPMSEILAKGRTPWLDVYNCYFNGFWADDGLMLSSLEFKGPSFSARFSGKVNRYHGALKGYAFLDTHAKVRVSDKRQLLRHIRSTKFHPEIYLLNMELDTVFRDTGIYFKDIKGQLNRYDLAAQGQLLWRAPPVLLFKGSLQKTDGNKGLFGVQGLAFECLAHFSAGRLLLENTRLRSVSQPTEGLAADLSADFAEIALQGKGDQRFFSFQKGKVDGSIREKDFSVAIPAAALTYNQVSDGEKIFRIRAAIGTGQVEATGWIHAGQGLSHWQAKIKGNQLDTKDFGLFRDGPIHLTGTVDLDLFAASRPDLVIKGEVGIREGRVSQFPFFDWLSDYFAIPEARDFSFDELRSAYEITSSEARWEDIRFHSAQLRLRGQLQLDRNDLVRSQIAVTIGRGWLESSRYLRPLLKRLGGVEEGLLLDFQLSGPWQRMNFQWLPSEAKSEIESAIPDFIERKIERNINTITEQTP